MFKDKLLRGCDVFTDLLIKFLIIFVPLFFVFGKGEHYYFSIYDIFKEVIIQSTAALLIGISLLNLYLTKEVRIKHSPLLWPLILFGLVLLSSSIQGINFYETFIFLKRWGLNLSIIFIAYNFIKDKKQIKSYLNYLILTGVVVSIYGILQHFNVDFKILHQNFTGNSTFGNPNFACEYILAIFPISLLLIFSPEKERNFVSFGVPFILLIVCIVFFKNPTFPREYLIVTFSLIVVLTLAAIRWGNFSFYATAAILLFAYMVFNKSRAVWIGGGVGGLIVVAYLIINFFRGRLSFKVGKNEKNHVVFVFKSFIALLVLMVALIMFSFTSVGKKIPPLTHVFNMTRTVIDEVGTLKHINAGKGEIKRGDTATQRLLIWKNTLRLVKENSILGVGIGNYKLRYQPYRTKAEQLSTGPDIFVRRSHNEYVQMLAEIGLFGIVFFFCIIIVSIRMCTRMIREANTFYAQVLALGFMLSLISSFISIFFNFSLQTPTPCITICLVLAFLMVAYDLFLKQENSSCLLQNIFLNFKKTLSHFMLILVVVCFALPVVLVRPAQAYYSYQFGQALEKMGLKANARDELSKSLKYFNHSWETHFVLSNVQAALGDLVAAKKGHQISLSLNPYHQKGHYNTANTLYKLGETKAAIEHYKKAIQIDSAFYQAYNNLGSIYFKESSIENHLEKSLECFKEVVSLNPNYPSGQYNIGYILFLMKRYKEAIPYVKHAYKMKPNDEKVKRLAFSLQKVLNELRAKQQNKKPTPNLGG